MKDDVVIVAATRTAIGKFNGSLINVTPASMSTSLIESFIKENGRVLKHIDCIIMGHVLTAGNGQNSARQASLQAGLPYDVSALTLNKVCGSGLEAVYHAMQLIQCGDADIVLAGGHENMSMAPYLMPSMRNGARMGHKEVIDSMIHDGLWDSFNNFHMGITAENLAKRYGITRDEQDQYAFDSQTKAKNALAENYFTQEITPLNVHQRGKKPMSFACDEQPRLTCLEKLNQLTPAFSKLGTVTAGNSSSVNDGAAMLMIASSTKANELELPVMARIKSYASTGVDPAFMGIGPVSASRKALHKAGWSLSDVDLIEANEAFAAQALAVGYELEWDPSKVNVNGGAIALGHPIGASGARILVTLLYELIRRNGQKGLATLCVGGGQGVAMTIEREITNRKK